MKFYKPKFWDYKKPNLFAYLLLPLTFPVLINNLLRNIIKPKKISNAVSFGDFKIDKSKPIKYPT